MKLAIDTGGTFTDIIFMKDDNKINFKKLPSTPDDYSKAILTGIKDVNSTMSNISFFIHGTTIATNAILQKTGANTALICTEGFKDLLDIKRGNRSGFGMLRADWVPPPPIIPRRNRLSVNERISYDGKILTPVNKNEIYNLVNILKERKIESVVISLLHSYINPVNEQKIKNIITDKYPEVFVCSSSDLIPLIREFERTSTVVANGYVGPLMNKYITNLENACSELDFNGNFSIMLSHGGIVSSSSAKTVPIRTVMSGPAAGVIASQIIGNSIGLNNIMSFDMGGTSTDVSLISDGNIQTIDESYIEFGVPILFPSLLVETIGAGGGTISWLDKFGNLKSGPQSSGSYPGPACYGNGGKSPTVTDAHVLLGRIDPKMFLSGNKILNPQLSKNVIKNLSDDFGTDVIETSFGIIKVTDSNMEKTMRKISTERGYDPRDFHLLAFGGAGPMHCIDLAHDMNMAGIIIPKFPGLTSAFGLLFADIKHDYIKTFNKSYETVDANDVEQVFEEGESIVLSKLIHEGFTKNNIVINRKFHMRYLGGFEPYNLQISIKSNKYDKKQINQTLKDFTTRHQQEFNYSLDAHPIIIEMISVEGIGVTQKPLFEKSKYNNSVGDALKGNRDVYFDSFGFQNTKIYDRNKLYFGAEISGPAVIEQLDSTIIIPPDNIAEIDKYSNIIINLK